MIKIAIVEDDEKYAKLLTDYIKQFSEEHQEIMLSNVHREAVSLVEKYNADYDILLLDIDLPHMTGMEAAQRIRLLDESVVIIFITNLAQYACEGYGVNALDFVVKPISYADFCMKMERAVVRVNVHRTHDYNIAISGGMYRVTTNQIVYVECISHKIIYHLDHGMVVESRDTLLNVEERLAPYNFLRVNKSFLVNVNHIIAVQGLKVSVSTGEDLYISQARRRDFLSELTTIKVGR